MQASQASSAIKQKANYNTIATPRNDSRNKEPVNINQYDNKGGNPFSGHPQAEIFDRLEQELTAIVETFQRERHAKKREID